MDAGELTPYELHGMQPVLFVADPTYAAPTIHIRFESPENGTTPGPSTDLWLHAGRGLNELCEVYRDRGVRIVDEPEDKPWGLRQFTIVDCNGYELCFCSETLGA